MNVVIFEMVLRECLKFYPFIPHLVHTMPTMSFTLKTCKVNIPVSFALKVLDAYVIKTVRCIWCIFGMV